MKKNLNYFSMFNFMCYEISCTIIIIFLYKIIEKIFKYLDRHNCINYIY